MNAVGEPVLAGPDGKELPTALIHKWASSRELLQELPLSERILFAMLLNLNQYYGVRREVLAYQTVVPELLKSASIRTPACCTYPPPSSHTPIPRITRLTTWIGLPQTIPPSTGLQRMPACAVRPSVRANRSMVAAR